MPIPRGGRARVRRGAGPRRGRMDRVRLEGEPFDVEQVQRRDVVARDGAAERARPERHRREEAVRVADRAERRHGVDHDAHGGLLQRERFDDALVRGVQPQRVADAAEVKHLDAAGTAGLPAIFRVEGQDGRERLHRERFVLAHPVHLADEGARAFGDREAGHAGDVGRTLAHLLDVQPALVEDDAPHGLLLLIVHEIGALLLHGFDQLRADGRIGDDGAFGGAERAPVERGAVEDVGGGFGQVGGAVHVDGHVAGADAVGRFALRVGGAHHGRAAGGQDEVGGRVFEQGVGAGQGDLRHTAEETLRSAGLVRGLGHHTERLGRARHGPGVRAHHDAAPCLRRNDGLVHGRGRGVGRRDQGGHDPHRRGDLPDRVVLQLADDAARFHAAHALVQRLRGKEVLERFALGPAEARFLMGHPGEALRFPLAGGGHGRHDAVHLFLREGFVRMLGLAGGAEQVAGLLYRA